MPQTLLGVRESIRIALDAEARADVESTWTAAGPVPGDPDWAGGDVFTDSRETVDRRARRRRVFDVLMALGGRQGWFRYNRLWRLRGLLDRLAGGPGWMRGRRDPARLSWGEALDFWRVTELARGDGGSPCARRCACRATRCSTSSCPRRRRAPSTVDTPGADRALPAARAWLACSTGMRCCRSTARCSTACSGGIADAATKRPPASDGAANGAITLGG